MHKILITGANGLLGQALTQEFCKTDLVLATGIEKKSFIESKNFTYKTLDITNFGACKQIILDFEPDVIINAASYTFVDECERQKELCWRINVKGVENLARLSRNQGAHLIHYSTDYIFDGTKGPYSENDLARPLGYYGKSKLASENTIKSLFSDYTIIRTCVLYGYGIQVKKNFFLWVYENLKSNKKINVVTDQYNNPTLAEDLAKGTRLVVENSAMGVYHMAGKKYLSRYEFAREIAEAFNLNSELIIPITTDQLKQAAPRPLRGGLDIEYAQNELNYNPRSIKDALIYLQYKMEKNGK